MKEEMFICSIIMAIPLVACLFGIYFTRDWGKHTYRTVSIVLGVILAVIIIGLWLAWWLVLGAPE